MALKNPRSVTLMVEEEEVRALTAIAMKENRSLAQLIRFAIRMYLSGEEYARKKERKAR